MTANTLYMWKVVWTTGEMAHLASFMVGPCKIGEVLGLAKDCQPHQIIDITRDSRTAVEGRTLQ